MPITKRYAMQRDNQRRKLYRAEDVLKAHSKRLETVKDIERFVEKLRKRATLVRRYGPELRRSFYIGDGRMRSKAGGDSRGIYMPRWSRTEFIVLHELAHSISIRKFGRSTIAGHGREFCGVYLDLVRYVLGKEAGEALKASFKAHGVKYKPKRRVSLPIAA